MELSYSKRSINISGRSRTLCVHFIHCTVLVPPPLKLIFKHLHMCLKAHAGHLRLLFPLPKVAITACVLQYEHYSMCAPCMLISWIGAFLWRLRSQLQGAAYFSCSYSFEHFCSAKSSREGRIAAVSATGHVCVLALTGFVVEQWV